MFRHTRTRRVFARGHSLVCRDECGNHIHIFSIVSYSISNFNFYTRGIWESVLGFLLELWEREFAFSSIGSARVKCLYYML